MQSKISNSIIRNSNLVIDSPKDNTYYVRCNNEWVDISSSQVISVLSKLLGGGVFRRI